MINDQKSGFFQKMKCSPTKNEIAICKQKRFANFCFFFHKICISMAIALKFDLWVWFYVLIKVKQFLPNSFFQCYQNFQHIAEKCTILLLIIILPFHACQVTPNLCILLFFFISFCLSSQLHLIQDNILIYKSITVRQTGRVKE